MENYWKNFPPRRKLKMSVGVVLLLLMILLQGTTNASHIMTSDSREEPEFEMVLTGIDQQKKEKINKDLVLLPLPVPAQPPSIFRHPHTSGGTSAANGLLLLDENLIRELDMKTELLRKIDELSKTGLSTEGCLRDSSEFELVRDVNLSTEFANVIMEKVDIIVSFLYKLKKYEARVKNKNDVERDEQDVFRYALETAKESYPIKDLRLLIYNTLSTEQHIYTLEGPFTEPKISPGPFYNVTKTLEKNSEVARKPWYFNPNQDFDHQRWMNHLNNTAVLRSTYHQNRAMDKGMNGASFWTWPYFNCSSTKNRKLLSESELEIRTVNYIPLQQRLHHRNQRFHSSSSSSSSSGRKNKRAAVKGHPVHAPHGGHIQHLRNYFHQQKLELENAWVASYTAWFPIKWKDRVVEEYGELSLDLDLSKFEINQCGFEDEGRREWDMKENPMFYFRDTHKCDRLRGTSTCHFIPGHPWRLGSYECRCTKNRYAYQRELNNTVSGAVAEAAWNTMRENKTNVNSSSVMYQDIVSCKTCPEGCDNCIEGLSCLAPIGWAFRTALLSTSITCCVGSVVLIFVTYKFRKAPVLKSSSPLFHCITLLGCVIMYSEMCALFPVLSQANCIAVKWSRHLGFCITYTALYMKLCRVFLTFRVKSAHKIKLTEKHLLHWMSPVMVVMLLYLFAWTISDPPSIEPMYTSDDLKFFQCVYNWWDHALAIGEMIFLGYGVWICWRIRENPDAQFISYSIYNIALTNLIMVSFHLLIVPQAGPDMKYLLAFLRTQFSTTVTIGLVFGSKLFSVLRGDPKAMKDIPTSANGFGHENIDLEEENHQLKEELTKMATQIEKLKSYAMCRNNPHLKNTTVNITAETDFNKTDPFSSL